MNNNTLYRHGDSSPYQARQDNILRNYNIVDIGIILQVTDNGKSATVQGYNLTSTGIKKYNGVELLYTSGENTDVTGNTCVLIRPASPILNVRKGLLNKASTIHQYQCIKAIPLYLNSSDVIVGRQGDGTYTIKSSSYNITFTNNGISIGCKDIGSMDVNSQGFMLSLANISAILGDELNILLSDTSGKPMHFYKYTEDGTLKQWFNAKELPEPEDFNDLTTFTKWSWTKTHNSDGSIIVEQLDDNQDTLNKMTIGADGIVTIVTGKTTISSNQEGNISINNTKGNIIIDKDGNITIGAATSKKISLGNGTSLLQILDDLYNALSTLQTKGSPAAQAADPTWVTSKLVPWQTKYQGVLA